MKAQVRMVEPIPVQEVGVVRGSVKEGDSLKPMWNIKMKVEPKAPEIGKKFTSKAYRGDPWTAGGGNTVKEVIDFEADELGNEEVRENAERVAKELGIDLSKVPAWHVNWVTYKKEDAEDYGNVYEFEMDEDNIVLTEDGGGGYLVLDHLSEHIKQNPDITVTQEQEGAGETSSEEMALWEKERGIDLKLNAWEIYKRLEEGHWNGNLAETVRKLSNTQYKKLESMVKRSLKDLDKSLVSKKSLEAVKKVRDAKTLEEAVSKLPLKGMQELDTSGSHQQEQVSSPVNVTEDRGNFDFSETGPTEAETVSSTNAFPWDKARKEKQEIKKEQQQKQEKERLEDYPKEEGIEEKHTLSKRVYLATVARDIQTGLTPENLSGYTKADMLSNAERAIDYVNNNYQKAVDILMYGGEAADAQGHILKGGIFNAVKHIATKSGDVRTLYDLALNSHVAKEATFLGQQIKAFDEMGQYDAISAIRKLGQYKKEAASHRIKDLDSAKQKEVENIKSFMGIDIAKLRKKLKSVFRNKDIYC
jgi:hypothetical protein